jgi:dolichol-phosphate mannosyltransferase
MKKLISIVIPAYNEAECVEELHNRLVSVFEVEKNYRFEVVIIENGSIDSTREKLKKIARKDVRFLIVCLSRNFRMDGGLTAGLEYINGDACVLMTADLQDPPEMIPIFLRKWEEGFENIYGVVTKRTGTSLIRRVNSKIFYWIANRVTETKLPKNASDFRLVDRKVYETVKIMSERNRFVRGLFAWVGFKSIGIPMVRPPRFGGESNATTLKTIDLALKGIFANSYKPLKLISLLGLFFSVTSLIAVIPLSYFWLERGVPFAGFGTIIGLILLTFGLLTLMIGIVSEYTALIYEEVKKRPNFIVSEIIHSSRIKNIK